MINIISLKDIRHVEGGRESCPICGKDYGLVIQSALNGKENRTTEEQVFMDILYHQNRIPTMCDECMKINQ